MAVAIAGIITVAVGSAMIVGLRTIFYTAETANQSQNSQLLATYLPADVQSTPAETDGTVGAYDTEVGTSITTLCSGSSVASSTFLLRLRWRDLSVADGGLFVAEYRRSGDELQRFACKEGSAASVAVVSREVTAASVDLAGNFVKMTVTVDDPDQNAAVGREGFTFTVSGTHRTLPACFPVAGSVIATPNRVGVTGGSLTGTVTVTFDTSGDCRSASVVVQKGNSITPTTTPQPATQLANTGSWSAVVPAETGWTTGRKRIAVTATAPNVAGAVEERGQLDVYDPNACAVVTSPAPFATPDPVLVVGGTLVATVTFSFSTSGSCSATDVEYTFGADDARRSALSPTQVTPGMWQTTIAPGSTGWTPGPKDFFVSATGAGTEAVGTFTVGTPPSCAVLTVSGPLTPVQLKKGYANTGPELSGPVAASFTTQPTCTAADLVVSYQVDGTSTLTPLPGFTSTGPGTWSAPVPAAAPTGSTWTTGAKILRVALATDATAKQDGSFTVAQGCGVLAASLHPSSVGVNRNSGQLDSNVRVDVTTTNACTTSEAITVRYQYGTATETLTSSSASGGPTAWTLVINKNASSPGTSRDWTTGEKSITVLLGGVEFAAPRLTVTS